MSDNPMFLYAGDDDSVDDVKADLGALKELHRERVVGLHPPATQHRGCWRGLGRFLGIPVRDDLLHALPWRGDRR